MSVSRIYSAAGFFASVFCIYCLNNTQVVAMPDYMRARWRRVSVQRPNELVRPACCSIAEGDGKACGHLWREVHAMRWRFWVSFALCAFTALR